MDTSGHLFFINILIFKPLSSSNNSEKFGMILWKPDNVTVSILFISKINSKASSSCMLTVVSELILPLPWALEYEKCLTGSRASGGVSACGVSLCSSSPCDCPSTFSSSCGPDPFSVLTFTRQSLFVCFCYTTVFVTIVFTLSHILFKPVFCFIILIFIIIMFVVSLERFL